MFLAVVFFCTSMDVGSCQVLGNNDNLWRTSEECLLDAETFAEVLREQDFYVRPGCFELNVGQAL